MALLDIAAEDVAIACCFQSNAGSSMLVSPTRKACASRRLAYPGAQSPTSSREAPAFSSKAPSPNAMVQYSRAMLPSSVTYTPHANDMAICRPSALHSGLLTPHQPSGSSTPQGRGDGHLEGSRKRKQPQAQCTPPAPPAKSLTTDARHRCALELERVHSNQTPITAFLQDLAHWQGQAG